MSSLQAGIGPTQIARAIQWLVGFPIAWSFTNALLQPLHTLDLPDPALWLVMTLASTTNEWWSHVGLLVVAALVELSDMAMLKHQEEYETRIHEIVKGIGDRLRAGAAVETAVTEACRTTTGPSAVFERAVELSDSLPFDAALREAADSCGNAYLREVCYLVAEAVSSEGDVGGAVRRLGMELERNHQYAVSILAKIANPVMVMRGVGLLFVPPLYAVLRASFNRYDGGGITLEPGATLFFTYGAVGITVYDGLIFGRWDRLMARLPLALGAVYIGLSWIS